MPWILESLVHLLEFPNELAILDYVILVPFHQLCCHSAACRLPVRTIELNRVDLCDPNPLDDQSHYCRTRGAAQIVQYAVRISTSRLSDCKTGIMKRWYF